MKLPQEEIERRVEEAAKILDIEYLLNRKPKVLSGGQRQRVALGRAMVREPVVFLLDEPLSNLDVKMRTELREQIVSLHRRLKTTFIYVTHDQAEAMQLGDRLAIMDTGKIVQTGTPQEIYNYPNSVYVAGFVGAPKMNFFASLLRETEKGWAIKLMGQEIVIPEGRLAKRDPALQAGKKVIVGVRPEEFRIEANGEAEDFETIEATLDRIVPMGPEMHAEAVCGKQRFLIVFANRANVQSGDVVKLHVNRWSVHVFDAETEKNLCRPVFKEMGR
ncbi:MAG: ATP-binding cassette domain-containing protein, partial [Clostridia bacterium]|nr:ATP-binding cassette domain-containing protein [Clostridia bacterium]